MKQTLTAVLLTAALSATAQNPVIRNQFTADPTARVFGDRIYLFPSHDIPTPDLGAGIDSTKAGPGLRKDWFCMADYHVFSSDNLIDWQDHGMILSQEQVPWGNPIGYSMWAPDCVEKNGTYYFFFPNAPREGRGFNIGVATAQKPEGPYTPEAAPIKGVMGIDPCCLLDDDGQAYLYWSGMGIRAAKLKENMKELAGEPRQMEGLPEGFKEGPFAFKQGGHYYLTFPWVRKEKGTETLAYAMSDSPMGPWQFKGIIMGEHANGCWTNHHSIVNYKGEWYLFYHHNDYSPAKDKRRSACIDRLTFLPDGTIQEVKPTLRGVGVNKATDRIEIDRYSQASQDVTLAQNDSLAPFQGWNALLPAKGSWLRYADVDFSMMGAKSYVVANVKAQENTVLTVREKDAKGKVIARLEIKVESTGQFRRDLRGQWLTVTAPLTYRPNGKTDLCLVSEGADVCIDWLQFKNRQQYFTPVAANAPAAKPDAEGFIRRWMILEPIACEIRSNTVFTDTYLREVFSKTYFKDQQTLLPRNGQKVKAGKQPLQWHAVESDRFNVKLFRFADQLDKRVYGVLFWAVTIIDCEEEINDVRLAAGSNGASMCWLNGEEVLLLSGDRRMVKDDGVSPRLTLKKGRNVLRCAVINGPGMSDLCVRFVDEKGKPVTNYKVITK